MLAQQGFDGLREFQSIQSGLARAYQGAAAVTENERRTGLRRFAGLDVSQGFALSDDTLDQYFAFAAALFAAEKPRRNDLGVVQYEKIARAQERRQIAEYAVLQAFRFDDEQPAVATGGRRIARDQTIRQVEIEVGKQHGRAWYQSHARPIGGLGGRRGRLQNVRERIQIRSSPTAS